MNIRKAYIKTETMLKPNKSVVRINCPQCGELQAKLYPWSSVLTIEHIPLCKRCRNKEMKKLRKVAR